MGISNLRTTLIASALLMTPFATTTRAGVTITISQVGPDVVATGSGTMDTSDLTNPILSFAVASLFPSVSGILVGPTTDTGLSSYTSHRPGPNHSARAYRRARHRVQGTFSESAPRLPMS